jgi:hypothetical protein
VKQSGKSIETDSYRAQMLDLVDKNFKAAITKMFKELKENIISITI